MKPQELGEAITALVRARQPFFIWGDPGIGKSQIIRQVADRLYAADYGYQTQGLRVFQSPSAVKGKATRRPVALADTAPRQWLLDLRAVLLDPVDLMGIPAIDPATQATYFAPPRVLPRKGSGLILFDELNRAPVMVMNGCLQLVLDRRLGEYRMPEAWTLGAAGNYESDAGVQRMSDALTSRFVHLTAETDANQWLDYAAAAGFHPAVVAFIRWRPDTLHRYDRKAKRAERSFPCPRTWEFASRLLANGALPPNVELELLRGTLGDGAATEFSAFLRMYRELPDLDQILRTPKTAPVPTGPATLYAVSSALASLADMANVGAVIRYLDRLPSPEYAAAAILDMERRKPELTVCRPVTEWKIRFPAFL